jgi:hypothetical protein
MGDDCEPRRGPDWEGIFLDAVFSIMAAYVLAVAAASAYYLATMVLW